MITAHLTKTRDGWKIAIVNGVKPLLENIITEATFRQKRDAKQFAKSVGAKAWNYWTETARASGPSLGENIMKQTILEILLGTLVFLYLWAFLFVLMSFWKLVIGETYNENRTFNAEIQ
jgi:hypothetical protein